jgi:hypothetical protein
MERTSYFPHDVDASHDPKLVLLRKRYGWEGYGWYWKIVEELGKHPEYKIPMDKHHLSYLQIELDAEIVKLTEFMSYCYELGLFCRDDNLMWSVALIKRMAPLENKRKQGRIAAEKRWGKKFVEPTPKEVEEYGQSINFKIDGEAFVSYYGARGWIMSNGRKMQCWKSAVVTWKKNSRQIEEPRERRDVSSELSRQMSQM